MARHGHDVDLERVVVGSVNGAIVSSVGLERCCTAHRWLASEVVDAEMSSITRRSLV